MSDYWLDDGGPAPAARPGQYPVYVGTASALVGTTVTVPDPHAGLVYRGRLAAYDYDTGIAVLFVTAERLLGDDEWFFPARPRRTTVRCALATMRPYTEGDTL